MKGTIASFRGTRRVKKGNQCIIHIDKIATKEDAEKLIGKTVIWTTPTKKETRTIKGKITAVHGRNGAVRALFEKGMPGQSLGKEVKIE